MKERTLFLIFLLMSFVAMPIAGNAGNVKLAPDNSFHLKREGYKETDITVTPEAKKYGDLWKKVLKTREVIPVKDKTYNIVKFTGPFYQKHIEIAEKVLLFNSEDKEVRVETDYKLGESTSPAYISTFLLLSLMAGIAHLSTQR